MFFKDSKILMEKYIGKSNNLEMCETQLDIIVKSISGEDYDATFKSSIVYTRGDANKTLEKLLTKEFNVKGVYITWEPSRLPDAHTMVTAFPIVEDIRNNELFKDVGRHNNPHINIYIVINTGMVKTYKMTSKEILAVILHEIGHNLDTSMLRLAMIIPLTMSMPVAPFLIYGYSNLYAWLERIDNRLLEIDFFNIAHNIIDKVSHAVYDLGIGRIIDIIRTIVGSSNIGIGAFDIVGYGREAVSDSVAQTYGYGPELATALKKLTLHKTTFNRAVAKIPIIRTVFQIQTLTFTLIVHALGLGAHPDLQARYKRIINKCKRDLQDPSLHPKMKKSLEIELDILEKSYDDLLNDENEKRTNYVFYIYRKVIDKLFAGKFDIRELLSKLIDNMEDVKY